MATFTLIRPDGTVFGTRTRKVSCERIFNSTTEVAAVLGPNGKIVLPVGGPDSELRRAEVARDAYLNPVEGGRGATVTKLKPKATPASKSETTVKARRAASGKTLRPGTILEERDRRMSQGILPSAIDPRDAHHSLKMMLGYTWGQYGSLNLNARMAKTILAELDLTGYINEDDILGIVKKHGGLVA